MKITREKLAAPLAYSITIVMAFIIGGVLILVFAHKNPLTAYRDFFGESFFSAYGILEVLSKATPIMIAGSGMVIAFKCGLWNLGAEGQMAIGAIISTVLGLYLPLPGILLLPAIFIASFIGGALWSGIAGYLKNRFGVHEMLATLMLNYIALKLMDYLINGPMIMPNPNYPRTSEILPQAHMAFLKYPLNTSIIIAILIIPLVWFLLNNTTLGYRLQAVGLDRKVARFSGMNITRLTLLVMFLCGGISSLGGTVEIVGDFFRMEKNVTGGYGFTAIVVVMIARENIIALPFASLFIAGVMVGATSLTLTGIPVTFSQIIIGLILLCVVFAGNLEQKFKMMWEE